MQDSGFSNENRVDDSDFDSASETTASESDDNSENCKFYHAIENNSTFIALQILDKGSVSCEFIDPTNTSQWTMLHWAAYHGNETVSIILCH